jgi:formyltetrahydrofolate deformylase
LNLQPRIVLKLQCPDQIGIVAKVTTLIAKHQGSIVDANEFCDVQNGQFFMRIEISAASIANNREQFETELNELAQQLKISWSLINLNQPKKVVILASKQEHCLADLLSRYISQDLTMNLLAVISNHVEHEKLVQAHDVPYHYVSFADSNVAFQEIDALLNRMNPDLIILARFMRILPAAICEKFAGRIINIHHSFLPSFIGANPYMQAYEKGVKMIGATCHYVTTDLDEGPIIEQDTIHINHRYSLSQIKQRGSDIEKIVLARGVRHHLEERIMLNGNKTIIFI